MTVKWKARHLQQGEDHFTEITITVIHEDTSSGSQTLKKLLSGIEHIRKTENTPEPPPEMLISYTDNTTYDWNNETYSGDLVLHLNEVDNATYQTRRGHMKDMTYIPIREEDQ